MKSDPKGCLFLIRAASWLVPAQRRAEWRREWEAEIICRSRLLEKWGRINSQTQFDLWKRVRGVALDVFWFQQARARMLLVLLNLVVAGLTAFGALQEFIVIGLFNRKSQPLLLSLAAMIVSVLFTICGVAMLRQWRAARRLIIVTGLLSILVHVYGALPPHRNMGYVALLVGAGYGLLMLLGFEWQRRRDLLV